MHIFVVVVLAGIFSLHALAVSSAPDTELLFLQHGRKEMPPAASSHVHAPSPTTVIRDLPAAPIRDPLADKQRARYNAEQYAHAVSESRRLRELATELEADLERAGDNTLPSGAFRKADEIARLAKNVKDRLKPR